MKETMEKEVNKFKKLTIVGILLVIIGVILMIQPISIIKERNREADRIRAEFQQEVDAWTDSWLSDDSSEMPTMGEIPGVPVNGVLLLMGSIVIVIVGVSMMFFGRTSKFYEKTITDEEIINKVKELASNNVDATESNVAPKQNSKSKRSKCENCGASKNGDICDYCGE